MDGKEQMSLDAAQRRHARLVARLGKLGLVLQGTITQRTILRESAEGPDTHKMYGPYYQWTYKRQGKTVTVNLTDTQAKAYQKAIDEHRKLEALLEEIRASSRLILEATTPGVVKRKH